VRGNPKVVEAITRILPFLTYGERGPMETLVAHFEPFLDFDAYDAGRSRDETTRFHVSAFVAIAQAMRNGRQEVHGWFTGASRSNISSILTPLNGRFCIARADDVGTKLKTLLFERGLVRRCAEYVLAHPPQPAEKGQREPTITASLPPVLGILVGLAPGLAARHCPIVRRHTVGP